MITETILRDWITTLALGQGLYQRLLNNLDDEPERWQELLNTINKKHIDNIVDFVMWYEQ